MSKQSLIELMAFQTPEAEVSFESAEQEFEIEIYLSGYDIDEIASKSSVNEHQEQWGIFVPKSDKNAASGSLRVRKTDVAGHDSIYEFTSKIKNGESGNSEAEDSVGSGQFEHFKLLADQGLIKQRFDIPATNKAGVAYTQEVDVFRNKDGELIPWVKIDAEVPEGTTITPEDIQLKYDEIIIVTPKTKADNVGGINEKLREMYDKYFCSKNVHV